MLLDQQRMKRRAIARALKISRNTVRQILAEHGEARATPHSALPAPTSLVRPSKLDPFRGRIDELLKTYSGVRRSPPARNRYRTILSLRACARSDG